MNLSDLSQLIPATERYAYFQTGGHALKPEPVIEEVVRWLRFQNQGPAVPSVHERMLQMQEDVRSRVARAINAEPSEIALTENATIGINVVANGIDWQPGDNVILSTHEHPGNRIPWYNIARRFGVKLHFVTATEDADSLLGEMEHVIDERTRLISISHVSRYTGLRFPAKEIVETAHRRGVPVLFDGAQSFGAIPVDVKALDCDFYTFSGHKYIMAPQGTGGLFARRDRISWLNPVWLGSHSQKEMDDEGHMTLHDSALRFEFGTRNMADQAGLGKALEIWESVGWDRVFGQIKAYTDCLKGALQTVPDLVLETPLPYEMSSSIVTFHVPGLDPSVLTERLLQQYSIVAGPSGTGGIRICTHTFNTDAEIERLVASVQQIQKQPQ